jgi:membrane-bound lytic murein transglycosylase D
MVKATQQHRISAKHLSQLVLSKSRFNSLCSPLIIALSCFALNCLTVHTANAETNAMGIELDLISDDELASFTNQINDTDTVANADNGDLWARIKSGYGIPNVKSEYLAKHEDWYASRPDYVKRMLERSQKYLFHIVEEVEKRHMPTEIALLPMIESAYNPQAYSTSHASGIWQFVPATGKNYGLKQNWWVDNRRNVTAATDAALTYLQKLHGMFGSWDLALAAYNAGEGTVQRAINRNRSLGLPTDYQNLNLPVETKNYVPKLQAIKNIVTNPEQFGIAIKPIPNQAYFVEVAAPKQIDAKLAAQLAEISLEEFNALNPSNKRPVITSTGDHNILLPTWAAERFKTNLANRDQPLTSWQTYNAKRGENTASIAKKFGIDASQLRSVNGLPASKKIPSAQPVLVPVNYNADAEANLIDESALADNDQEIEAAENEPSAKGPRAHKVKRGETLANIAKKYNTSPNALMKINHLKSSKVKVGQLIQLNLTSQKSTKAASKHVATKSRNNAGNRIKARSGRRVVASKGHHSRQVKARSHTKIR